MCIAIETLLHDVNSLDAENAEAVTAAKKCSTIIRVLDPLVSLIFPALAPPAISLFPIAQVPDGSTERFAVMMRTTRR